MALTQKAPENASIIVSSGTTLINTGALIKSTTIPHHITDVTSRYYLGKESSRILNYTENKRKAFPPHEAG